MTYVYTLEHVESGMLYIGSTNNITARHANHFNALKRGKHPNRLLQETYNRSPDFKLTYHVMSSIEVARATEVNYIKLLRDSGKLLNLTGVVDLIWTPAMRASLADKKRGIPKSKEARERMSISKTGMNHTEETRLKMSRTRSGTTQNAEWIEKRSISKRKSIVADGVEYNSLTAAANAHGIHIQTVSDRVHSTKEKYKTWHFK